MAIRLYTGPTGCGKTFFAIRTVGKGRFVILVPCRQLAYGIYLEYPEITGLDTGEVHLGNMFGNRVCVYENLGAQVIPQATLIVDEAHYLNDPERGAALLETILVNAKAGKEIILLTATDTISDELRTLLDIEEVALEPFQPEVEKIQIDQQEFARRVHAGMYSLVFTKHAPDERDRQYYAQRFRIDPELVGVVSANTPSYERLRTQIDFTERRLQVVVASNVLAQGLNFPAQGVLVEYNEYDDWEVVTQKIGRIVRPLEGYTQGFFALLWMPEKKMRKGLPVRIERSPQWYYRPSGRRIFVWDWGFQEHQVPTSFDQYTDYKYSRAFLEELFLRANVLEAEEAAALAFLEEQERLIRTLLPKR